MPNPCDAADAGPSYYPAFTSEREPARGRSGAASHQDLRITAGEWEAFLDDFQQTLDKFGVPPAEQAKLKAIVASTRADIVV